MVQPRLLGIVVVVMLVAALLMISGCATFQNTPAQDRTWAAYAICQSRVPNNVQIDRVEPSGRYWWRTRDGSFGVAQLTTCIAEESRTLKAAGR